MSKSEARQIPMGKCGHKIVRIKRGKVLMWWCYDHNERGELDRIALAPRGKAK